MTRKELHNLIAQRVKEEFAPGKRNANDGSFRTVLTDYDCDYIADVVFSTIGRSGLGIYDVTPVVTGEEN